MLAKLDQFIFTEDVQLGDVTGHVRADRGRRARTRRARSSAALGGVSAERAGGAAEHGNVRAEFGGGAGDRHARDRHRRARIRRVRRARAGGRARRRRSRAAGVVELDAATAEAMRIEAGVPKFHRDMDEETIPLEAGHRIARDQLDKGCYVGQEVDHSRAAPRPRPRGAQAGRARARRRRGAGRRARRSQSATARSAA